MSVDYQPNSKGKRALLRLSGTQRLVTGGADKVAAKANAVGEGYYGVNSRMQSVSAHAYAYTGNYTAMKETARDDVLLRALGGV